MTNKDYTSAANMPTKLFHNPVIQNSKIVPYHITVIPTNICNEKCPECFCYNRDPKKQMDFFTYKKIVDTFYDLGTRAISYSGGGEPDCHPEINLFLNYAQQKSIDTALVSNGKNLRTINTQELNNLEWIRISATTSRPVNLEGLVEHMRRAPEADWGMSYIVNDVDKEYVKKLVDFANDNPITHIRMVSDMRTPYVNHLPDLREYIESLNTDSSKIVWQERTQNKLGVKECLLSLLHPVIDVDGNVQPCCGAHFSSDPPAFDFNKKTSMCHYTQYPERINKQLPFDGTNCAVCQYDDYNKVLEILKTKPTHSKFV